MDLAVFAFMLVFPLVFFILSMKPREKGYENVKMVMYFVAASACLLAAIMFIGATEVNQTMTHEPRTEGMITVDCHSIQLRSQPDLEIPTVTCTSGSANAMHTAFPQNVNTTSYTSVRTGANATNSIQINMPLSADFLRGLSASQPSMYEPVNAADRTTWHVIRAENMQPVAYALAGFYLLLGIIMSLFAFHELARLAHGITTPRRGP